KKKGHTFAGIDAKVLVAALGIALLAAIPLRTVQLFTNMENYTGFFEEVDWTVYVVYAVFAVAAVVLAVLPALSAKLPASRPVVRKNKALAFGAFAFAAGIAYDVALGLVKVLRTMDGITAKTVLTVLFTNGMFALILQIICGVAACIFMVLVGLSYTGERATYGEYRLLALMPLFWTLFRLVARFMTKISFTMVSELLLELAMLCFMMLFLLSFARISAQISQKGEMKKAFCFGLPAAFFALTIGVTRLICTVGGRAELLADGFSFSLADLGFGIFAAVYLYVHMQYGRPASEDDALPEAYASPEQRPADERLDENFLEE
ncbi:MAG: hypothetical protein ACI4LB_02145, partial [Candidatus Fimenecus sp.]